MFFREVLELNKPIFFRLLTKCNIAQVLRVIEMISTLSHNNIMNNKSDEKNEIKRLDGNEEQHEKAGETKNER